MRRRLAAGRSSLALGLGGLIAFAISRIDVGETIREVTLPLRHDDIIRQQAEEKNLDPALIAAVIYEESRFRDQTSSAGARGLMQITPETAEAIAELSGGVDVRDRGPGRPRHQYPLRHLLPQPSARALRRQRRRRARRLQRGPGQRRALGWRRLELDDIGFPETRAYVDNVLERREQYRENYAEDLGL